jgi:hypothetical protein
LAFPTYSKTLVDTEGDNNLRSINLWANTGMYSYCRQLGSKGITKNFKLVSNVFTACPGHAGGIAQTPTYTTSVVSSALTHYIEDLGVLVLLLLGSVSVKENAQSN